MKLSFAVVTPPRGQMRARSRAIVSKSGRAFATTYKSCKQRAEERTLEALFFEYKPESPLEGALQLTVKAFFKIPASKTNKFRANVSAGIERPTVKPDIDNVIKNVMDVMQGVFFEDDKQIVEFGPGTGKYYTAEAARYEVTLAHLGES